MFGPFTDGFSLVDFNRSDLVEEHLRNTPNCVAVKLEPIQGEGGINIPDEDFLPKVKALCKQYNALLIVDEV